MNKAHKNGLALTRRTSPPQKWKQVIESQEPISISQLQFEPLHGVVGMP